MRRFACLSLLLVACGGEGETPDPPVPETCDPPLTVDADGACVAVAMQADGCLAGEVMGPQGCEPAGLSPAWCAEGFVFDELEQSCEPVLPAEDCPPGEMAIPGDEACRPVMPCPDEPWGGIPVEPLMQYVDADYAGGDSDGTMAKPWTLIGDAVAASSLGGVVAVEAGTYVESVNVALEGLSIRGVCPERVVVEATGSAAFVITGNGVELVGMSTQGGLAGVGATGATEVRLDRLWIRDTGDRGITIEDSFGYAQARITDSLISGAPRGITVLRGTVDVERTQIRDMPLAAGETAGRGIEIDGLPEFPSAIRHSHVLRARDAGILILGASAFIEGTVVRDTLLREDSRTARGIGLRNQEEGGPANAEIRSSYISGTRGDGLAVQGSVALVEGLVSRDNLPGPDLVEGFGIDVLDGDTAGMRSSVVLRRSLLTGNTAVGLFVGGSDLYAEGILVRDTLPRESDLQAGFGIAGYDVPLTGEAVNLQVVASRSTGNTGTAFTVVGGTGWLSGVVAENTAPRAADGLLGDGVAVARQGTIEAVCGIENSLMASNARAGLSVFGGQASLFGSRLSCQPIDLAAEPFNGFDPVLTNAGANVCGCESAVVCKALASGLAPPESID